MWRFTRFQVLLNQNVDSCPQSGRRRSEVLCLFEFCNLRHGDVNFVRSLSLHSSMQLSLLQSICIPYGFLYVVFGNMSDLPFTIWSRKSLAPYAAAFYPPMGDCESSRCFAALSMACETLMAVCRIVKLVRALRKGWIKRERDIVKEPEAYLLWGDGGSTMESMATGHLPSKP